MSTHVRNMTKTGVSSLPCPACEAGARAGHSFCHACGRELPATATESPSPVPVTVSAKKNAVAENPANDEHDVFVNMPAVRTPRHADGSNEERESARPPTDLETCCLTCGALKRHPQLFVSWRSDDGKVSRTPLVGDEMIIGTDEACDLIIVDDSYVSRRHTRLSVDNRMIWVEDLASSNGTLLRLRRPVVIEPGDELLIGTTVLSVDTDSD